MRTDLLLARFLGLWEGTSNGGCNASMQGCDLCDGLVVAQNLAEFLFEIAGVIAVGMIVWGGIRLMTAGGSPKNLSASKEIFKKAGIGLVVALTSWLIVNTIIHLAAADPKFEVWDQISCAHASQRQTLLDYATSTMTTDRGIEDPLAAINLLNLPELPSKSRLEYFGNTYDHGEAYTNLRAAGVSVWSSRGGMNNCATTPPCGTGLDGLPKYVVTRLIKIKRECLCDVVVTGGTESHSYITGGRSEHAPGSPTVDLDDNAGLGRYLDQHWEELAIRKVLLPAAIQSSYPGLCQKTRRATGKSCGDPSPQGHFHVVFNTLTSDFRD